MYYRQISEWMNYTMQIVQWCKAQHSFLGEELSWEDEYQYWCSVCVDYGICFSDLKLSVTQVYMWLYSAHCKCSTRHFPKFAFNRLTGSNYTDFQRPQRWSSSEGRQNTKRISNLGSMIYWRTNPYQIIVFCLFF